MRWKMNVTLPSGEEIFPLTEYTSEEELESAAREFRLTHGEMWMEIETGDKQLTNYFARYGKLLMNIHKMED